MNINKIIDRQRAFQALAEVKIDTLVAKDINGISEMYLFKAIEEIVELRKTFPSELNKWSKSQPAEQNRTELLGELSDVLLFIINFCIVRKITPEMLVEAIGKVQDNNFYRLKSKKLGILIDEMRRLPVHGITAGGGGLMPKVILIGQSFNIEQGSNQQPIKNYWDYPELFPSVEYFQRAMAFGRYRLLLKLDDYYYTEIIKEPVTPVTNVNNPLIEYWVPFLNREIVTVSAGCNPIILALGDRVNAMLSQQQLDFTYTVIRSPEEYLASGVPANRYYEEVLIPALSRYDLEQELGF